MHSLVGPILIGVMFQHFALGALHDPIHGFDFAGYNIYRGTDEGLSDAFTITDAQGNPTLYKPIIQFNKADDGWYGIHPVETENGIHFYMGDDDDSGLSHSVPFERMVTIRWMCFSSDSREIGFKIKLFTSNRMAE